MTDPEPKPEPVAASAAGAKAPRWMKAALAISVALNLAIVGLVVGAVVKDGPPMRRELVRDLSFGPLTEAFSTEDRMALRRAFLEAAPDFRDQRRMIRADVEAMLTLLRAEPFDGAALETLLEQQQARNLSRFDLGQDLIIERLAAMTPADRAAFADRLQDSLSRGRGGKGDGDGGRGDRKGND